MAEPWMDWTQVAMNGGPPCFFVEGPQFCGRAERWGGHGNPAFHNYVSLEDYVNSARASAEWQLSTCLWQMDAWDELEEWRTACGQSWAFTEGTPSENKMLYCCYCGKGLQERVNLPDNPEGE